MVRGKTMFKNKNIKLIIAVMLITIVLLPLKLSGVISYTVFADENDEVVTPWNYYKFNGNNFATEMMQLMENDRDTITPGSGCRWDSGNIRDLEHYLKILCNAPEMQLDYKPKRDKKGFINDEGYMLTREWLTDLLYVYVHAWRDVEKHDKKTPYGQLFKDPDTVIDEYLNNKTFFPKFLINTKLKDDLIWVYASMAEAQFYKFLNVLKKNNRNFEAE